MTYNQSGYLKEVLLGILSTEQVLDCFKNSNNDNRQMLILHNVKLVIK